MRKSSRLNTTERAVLIIASKGDVFSIHSICQKIQNIYTDLENVDIYRAVKALAKLNFFDITLHDPYFSNRPSYILNSLGQNFWKEHQLQEQKLYSLINT